MSTTTHKEAQISVASNSQSPFELIKQIDSQGREFWFARELMPLLGYPRFDSFKRLILKTIADFEKETISFHNHVELLKIETNNPNLKEDYKLSRFFCYKLAMLGNTQKCVLARTYFAIQARKQEIQEQNLNPVAPSQPTNQFDFLRGLLDSLENQSLRISTVENKLEKVIEIKQNILDIVGEAPEKTARISLRQLVENYCEKHRDEPFIYQTTWGVLYREVKDRLHADVKARAKEYNKNLKKEGGKKKDEKRAIDFIEELGLEKPTIAIFLEITAEKFE